MKAAAVCVAQFAMLSLLGQSVGVLDGQHDDNQVDGTTSHQTEVMLFTSVSSC